ncbi:MAG: zinc-dependent metalloprotease [Brevibacterium sp.]
MAERQWPVAQNPRFLVHAIVTEGIGSAQLGADRGQTTRGLVVRADRHERGYVLTAENTAYGFTDGAEHVARSVRESFAESVLVGDASSEEGEFDPAGLGYVDYFDTAAKLSEHRGEAYELIPERSRVRQTQWFDDILAIDAVLTFGIIQHTTPGSGENGTTGKAASAQNASGGTQKPVHPAPASVVSFTQRVTLRPLPDTGFTPVSFDPTAGQASYFIVHRFDRHASQDARTVLAPRYRLSCSPGNGQDRVGSAGELPAALQPRSGRIVYRLDPGIPAPFHDALLEGFNWWAEAFAKAGFPDVFSVEPLPAGEDLFDPRFGSISWTHRADRGWSYGMSQLDPRTGEILKGSVIMGSQRIEEIRAIAEAVLAPYGADADDSGSGADEVDRLVRARLTTLAAHEIGHSLGFAHNFASHHQSTLSVMDYPAPVFDLDAEGRPSIPDGPGAPYAQGLGPWDEFIVSALYAPETSPIAPTAEPLFGASTERPTQTPGAEVKAPRYATDADTRNAEYAEAGGATWKSHGSPVARWESTARVRAAALQRFSPAVVPRGQDSNELERRFRLLYLFHRFHVSSAIKAVGGTTRDYALTGRESFAGAVSTVPVEAQLAVIDSVKQALTPEFLQIPPHIAPLLTPPSGGVAPREGGFAHRTAGATDIAEVVGTGNRDRRRSAAGARAAQPCGAAITECAGLPARGDGGHCPAHPGPGEWSHRRGGLC